VRIEKGKDGGDIAVSQIERESFVPEKERLVGRGNDKYFYNQHYIVGV